MNKDSPIIFLDLKKDCIRIHKSTLSHLGNPAFIQLLINPNSCNIVIHPAIEEDHLSIRVVYPKLETHSFEVYSKSLMQSIRSISPFLQGKTSFKVCGEYLSKNNLTLFSLRDNADQNTTEGGNQA